MRLAVVIPARNEQDNIGSTLAAIGTALAAANIDHEIIVVDDGSTDDTAAVVRRFAERDPRIRLVVNNGRHGFGMAVRAGLADCRSEAVAVMMADCSDSPDDLAKYYRAIEQGYDCAFGSRFVVGSSVIGYPKHKLILNRLGNTLIRLLFGLRFNDVTNAFKCYRREVIEGMQPLISPHFNLTVEMPLKAVVRGYSYAVLPITWRNRTAGVSKLRIKEMGSRYLFIILYLWLEKHLSKGDYHRRHSDVTRGEQSAVHTHV